MDHGSIITLIIVDSLFFLLSFVFCYCLWLVLSLIFTTYYYMMKHESYHFVAVFSAKGFHSEPLKSFAHILGNLGH